MFNKRFIFAKGRLHESLTEPGATAMRACNECYLAHSAPSLDGSIQSAGLGMRFAATECSTDRFAKSLRDGAQQPTLPSRMKEIRLTCADREGYAREVYSVEGVRVTVDPARGWRCTCKAFAQGLQCIHIDQAHAFRQMRGAKRDDDATRVELSAGELRALYIAAAVEHADFHPSETVVTPKRVLRHSHWAAAVLAAAGIAAISSGATYLATVRTQEIRVAENGPPEPSIAPATQATPLARVKFANPFDATEVFEFPPGMSENDAREAVAEILLNRARERLSAPAEMQQRSGQVVHRDKPVRAQRVANRSH